MGSSFGRLFRISTPGGAAVLDKAPERLRKTSPRYKVLLHNDPINTMEDVVMTLQQVVPSLSEQDAIAVMLETHNTGVGLPTALDRHLFVYARALWLGLAAEPAPGRAPGVTGSWPAARPTGPGRGAAGPGGGVRPGASLGPGVALGLQRRADGGLLWGAIGLHGGLVGGWFALQAGLLELLPQAPSWLAGPGGAHPNPIGGLVGWIALAGLLLLLRPWWSGQTVPPGPPSPAEGN